MKKLLTTAPQKLTEILTQEEQKRVIQLKDDKKFSVSFMAGAIGNAYIETLGYDATTTDGAPITQYTISLAESQLNEISLVGDIDGTEIYLLFA